MQLPFTKEQFFDLLAAYNAGLWPALLALWIASVLVCVLLLSSRRPPDRWHQCPPRCALGLVRDGVPRGVLYPHQPGRLGVRGAVPAAGGGVLLGRSRARALSFAPWRNAWAPVAWGLVAYRSYIRRSTRLNI